MLDLSTSHAGEGHDTFSPGYKEKQFIEAQESLKNIQYILKAARTLVQLKP